MNQEELDTILRVVENPVRRKIIRRLSQEPCYALQLSKELGLGQPLVAKHLAVIEGAGLVTSVPQASPSGPPRKKYSLARGVSISVDLGPNIFIERGVAAEAQVKKRSSPKSGQLRRRVQEAIGARDERKRLTMLSVLLTEVDKKIDEMEGERAELLEVRNLAMGEAAQIVNKTGESDMRRVLFHILNEHSKAIESISEALDLREMSVKEILLELERDYFE